MPIKRRGVEIVGDGWKNPESLVIERGVGKKPKCCRKAYGFFSQICIKVILLSAQNEIRLNHTTHAISVLSYDTIYLQAKVSPLKIAFAEIILPKINRRGLE